MAKQSTIYFYGGAGSVTGSHFLLDTGGAKLLVDCGLFQGREAAEETNWSEFPYDPKEIQYLINTHAHIDHIGRIPLLVKRGFKDKIISTEATKAIAEPLLLDSMELLAHVARQSGREPLYDEKDIAVAMKLWEGHAYHEKISLPDGITLEFLNSGHILGSAMVKFSREGKSIVFTGDLGGGNSPLLKESEIPKGIDYLVMESVYGNRIQAQKEHRREALEDVIEDVAKRNGTLLIPAFSNERTQDLLFEVRTLMVEKKVPSMPVFIDSPLAQKITEAFLRYPNYFSNDIRARVEAGENIFNFPELKFVEGMEESRAIDSAPNPKIVVAGSGMSNGGRVRSHQMHILPDPNSTLLIVGYQSAGSLGRRLIEGLTIADFRGEKIPVKCKVEAIYAYSAHMDGEQLVEFVNGIGAPLKQVFVVMGEPIASSTLVQRIRDYLGVKAIAPEAGENAKIDF
ncbi:MAG: MBL fold metallo-hydrolase [bacterium]|nr:MBL fold metallo-hydrolase [bacterium]